MTEEEYASLTRPWKDNAAQVTQRQYVTLNDQGKHQVVTGPGVELKVWVPLEDIREAFQDYSSPP